MYYERTASFYDLYSKLQRFVQVLPPQSSIQQSLGNYPGEDAAESDLQEWLANYSDLTADSLYFEEYIEDWPTGEKPSYIEVHHDPKILLMCEHLANCFRFLRLVDGA